MQLEKSEPLQMSAGQAVVVFILGLLDKSSSEGQLENMVKGYCNIRIHLLFL